jgi:hypothetical protein
MTFPFNNAIPNANNNPSVDQPQMLLNNQSTFSIMAVDHIGFDAAFGGNHLQVHLPQFTAPTVINGSATQGSVVYSKAGTTDTAHAQLFFKNANGIDFLLSAIRAFGSFLMTNGNNTKINGENFNVLVTGNSAVVSLSNNATDGSTNFVVISNINFTGVTATYVIAPNKITFTVPVAAAGSILSFIVMQI